MKWARFEHRGAACYGVVEGDQVAVVEGSPWADNRRTGERAPLASLKLLVPVIPGTFYCAGANYASHVVRMAQRNGVEPKIPPAPHIGYRANSALIAHGEPIVKPKDASDQFQYEGELVAVFGKRARNVSKAEALDCVFGWTIGNDVSERVWQKQDGTLWRAKNSDTFKPMGPFIVTDPDFDDMKTIIRIDDEEVESFDTLNMIFDAATFISETSRYITFQPGDVMWLGTDGLPRNLRPGNTVAIEITGVGTLSNPVVAEA